MYSDLQHLMSPSLKCQSCRVLCVVPVLWNARKTVKTSEVSII